MITRLWKARVLHMAGLAVAAVAIGGTALIVTASAAGLSFGLHPPQTGSTTEAASDATGAKAQSNVCGDFMKHFAIEIGKTQAQINDAFQKAIADTLGDEVKSGKISQSQADAIKARLAKQTPCALPSTIGRQPKGPALGAYLQEYMSAAAAALGISQAQLMTDLKSGQSLSQIAAAQNLTEADFRAKLIANLKPALDQAVTNKKLTAVQEQALLNRLQTGPLPLWNGLTPRPASPPSAVASPAAT